MDREISPIEVGRGRRRRLLRWSLAAIAVAAALVTLRAAISPGVARDEVRLARVERGEVIASLSAAGRVVPWSVDGES